MPFGVQSGHFSIGLTDLKNFGISLAKSEGCLSGVWDNQKEMKPETTGAAKLVPTPL